MDEQVHRPRRVGIYGNQLVLSVLAASLQGKPSLEVQRIDDCSDFVDNPAATIPDVILFDLTGSQIHFAIQLMRLLPTTTVIGVDLENSRMLSLFGKESALFTEEDLIQAIEGKTSAKDRKDNG
ncbi:MAG: hypothetical protein AB7W37_10080 [Syntrophobacteraceae bacterium]